jgi:uncharacterized protein YdaU (DUF1376 family)
MSKDPAFPFYAQDFLTGVMHLTMEERGQYITLLSYQWEHDEIPKKRLGLLVGCAWENLSPELKSKFDETELSIVNKRLEDERDKRARFKEKQSGNGKLGGRPPKPKLNPNESQTDTQTQTQKKPLESEYEKEDEDIKEKENKKPKPAKTDLQFLIDRFNEKCDKLPKCRSLTDTRKTALKNRIDEHGIDQIEVVFELVSESNFLNGDNGTGFTASIDWVLKQQNFIKILEGNYKNKTNGNRNNNHQRSDAERKQSALAAASSMRGFRQSE